MKREQIIVDVLSRIRTFPVSVKHEHERSNRQDHLLLVFHRDIGDSRAHWVLVHIGGGGEGPFTYNLEFSTFDELKGKRDHYLRGYACTSEDGYKKMCELVAEYLKKGKDAKGLPTPA